MNRRRYYRPELASLNIPAKANIILNIFFIGIVLILIRSWHLGVVQHEDKIEAARRPRYRTVVEPAKRATIRDRFNEPLAINKLHYQAAISYAQLKEIPAVVWEPGADGKKVKKFRRKEYVVQLSQLLGKILQMDPERIEDLIYSKATLQHQIPYILKEGISESEYYRLKMLEKDWPGIHARQTSKRSYPHGRIAGDIVGYMGAISRHEYDAIVGKIKTYEDYLNLKEEGEDPPLPAGLTSENQLRELLKELREHSYTLNDSVGKSGIEAMFENELRGAYGKKRYYSDARGNFLRETTGSYEPVAGHRLLLTISTELQEFAEQLLIQNEGIRQAKISKGDSLSNTRQPWIKGGAIVALDPNTGEVLALASYPRFDPNDFIPGNKIESRQKKSGVLRWLETESHIAQIWDQQIPIEREVYDPQSKSNYDEPVMMSWERYLQWILPAESSIRKSLDKLKTVENAASLQNSVDQLLAKSRQDNLYLLLNTLYSTGDHISHKISSSTIEKEKIAENLKREEAAVKMLKAQIDPFLKEIPHNYEKAMLIDLCRVAVPNHYFSKEMLQKCGKQTIAKYRDFSSASTTLSEALFLKAKKLYHDLDFKEWRKSNEKQFLKEKREEEKRNKTYAKPYLDYFDEAERISFQQFWNKNRYYLMLSFLKKTALEASDLGSREIEELSPYLKEIVDSKPKALLDEHLEIAYQLLSKTIQGWDDNTAIEYLKTFRSFQELNRPLLGSYRHLRKEASLQLEKHLAAAFYPLYGYGYGRSQAYRQGAIQGSIFKLVTAYAALIQNYNSLTSSGKSGDLLNPLEMIDNTHSNGRGWNIGYTSSGQPIPQNYKGGRIPRSHTHFIGKVDLLRAIETSSNPYFSILAGDVLESPTDLLDAAHLFSYGARTGISLPGEFPGRLPQDLDINRTGLYAFAIGQHSLVVTPLQSAVMLASIANHGKVLEPKIVRYKVGKQRKLSSESILKNQSYDYQENLAAVGINFPLFAATLNNGKENQVQEIQTAIKREIPMPPIVRNMLLEGMHRVVQRNQMEGIATLSKIYQNHPEAIRSIQTLKNQIAGKTSTAEALETVDLDFHHGTNLYKHVWFGGIGFEEDYDETDRIKPGSSGSERFVFKDRFGNPELVVVVYLRFGSYGKESIPLGAQMLQKWREIKQKHLITNATADQLK